MKKIFILIIIGFAFPIFAQNIELSDTTMSQFWNSLSEEQRNAIVAEFSEIQAQFEKSKNPQDELSAQTVDTLPKEKQIEIKKNSETAASYYMSLNKFDDDEREDVRHFVLSHSDDNDVYEQIEDMRGIEKSIAQKYMSMNEDDQAIIKKMLYNEDEYFSAKSKLKKGIILSSIGVYVGSLATALYVNNRDINDWEAGIGTFFGGLGIFAGGGLLSAGVPLIVIGAINKDKYQKYKPQIAISPNSVNLTMEF